jgi:hypothetical protein
LNAAEEGPVRNWYRNRRESVRSSDAQHGRVVKAQSEQKLTRIYPAHQQTAVRRNENMHVCRRRDINQQIREED